MRGNFVTDRRGELNPNYKDGRKNTRLYSIYANILSRCFNPNVDCYHLYGGRGITVCAEWKNDFKAFYDWSMSNGYADNLSIDRVDNNEGYSPDNCRWVTMRMQSNNRRNNVHVTMNNECKTLSEWCELYGINYKTVRDRLKRGWSYEDALTKSVQIKFRRKVM